MEKTLKFSVVFQSDEILGLLYMLYLSTDTELVLHTACQTDEFQTADHKIMMETW